jgi:tetratricopeptide (TPR) repeat protein
VIINRNYRTVLCAIILILVSLQSVSGIALEDIDMIISSEKEPRIVVEKLLEQSKLLEDTDLTKAIQFAVAAFDYAMQHEAYKSMMDALIQQNNLYFLQSNYEAAMRTADKLRKLSTIHQNEAMIGYALLLEGRVFGELGAYDKSSEKFFESLRYFELLKHKEGITETLGYIGNLFSSQGHYDKALEYLNRALTEAKHLDDKSLISMQLNNIAVVYLNREEYDLALDYLNDSYLIDLEIGDKLNQGVTIFNKGFAELRQHQYAEAYVSFSRAYDLYMELGNELQIARCYLAFASISYELDSIDQSKIYLTKALEKGLEKNYHRIVFKAANGLHELSLFENDTINAYRYAKLENNAEDSLHLSENQTQLAKLEFQYLYEKTELERRLALQARNTFYTIVFICLFAGIIILALLLSRHRIKAKKVAIEKQAVESQLEFKSKELTINLLALLKKNEMLSDISRSLINIEKEAKKEETKEALSRVRKEIRQNTDEKLLNEFSMRFQEVHAGFYKALLEKFPELTQSELKLCAFLRLNMTSKDISELTGQRVQTLENARYRLRKKLGISNSDVNLVTFLSQI